MFPSPRWFVQSVLSCDTQVRQPPICLSLRRPLPRHQTVDRLHPSESHIPKAAGASHDNPRAQTCTFQGPTTNTHQDSTRRPPRGRKELWWWEKKDGRGVREGGSGGRGEHPNLGRTPYQHTSHHTRQHTPHNNNNNNNNTNNTLTHRIGPSRIGLNRGKNCGHQNWSPTGPSRPLA